MSDTCLIRGKTKLVSKVLKTGQAILSNKGRIGLRKSKGEDQMNYVLEKDEFQILEKPSNNKFMLGCNLNNVVSSLESSREKVPFFWEQVRNKWLRFRLIVGKFRCVWNTPALDFCSKGPENQRMPLHLHINCYIMLIISGNTIPFSILHIKIIFLDHAN